MFDDPVNVRILRRAYDLWRRSGRPEAKREEFWERAAAEINAETIAWTQSAWAGGMISQSNVATQQRANPRG